MGAEYRFVLDDASVWFGDLDPADIGESLALTSEQIQLARERQERTGAVTGFESLECRPGELLFELLTSCDEIDRDTRILFLGLLDKCGKFDADPDFYVEPDVVVDTHSARSYAIATAVLAARSRDAIGVLGVAPVYGPGRVSVTDASGTDVVVVVTTPESRHDYYRWVYATEDVDESAFFELARLAFPRLRFADGVTFRRFEGTYEHLRDHVVEHLSKINDHFQASYESHQGRSDEISAAMGIDISMESPSTRQSERLMRARDFELGGRSYRCEWHSKIEPHRNRIHLHPGDANSDACVVIGVFVDHLPT